jgi:hypothetical protein
MLYYRCKCGNTQAWGSMPPNRCDKCESCGSDLALDPEGHREPSPHDFSAVQEVVTDQGTATITRCRHCYRTKAELESD